MHLKVAIIGSDENVLSNIRQLLEQAANAPSPAAKMPDEERTQRVHLAPFFYDRGTQSPMIDSIDTHCLQTGRPVPAAVARDANLIIITDPTIQRPDRDDVAFIRITGKANREHRANDAQS